MKKIKYFNLFLAAVMALAVTSCNTMLNESPKSQLTPDFFKTSQGAQFGVNASYSGLRALFGPQSTNYFCNVGTDEFTTTDQTGGADILDSYDPTKYIPSNGNMSTYWTNCLQYINTCNGVIQYGATSGVSTSLLAEAHFLRGLYYYLITMYYGDVPLDLGAGKLAFNSTPSTSSVRDSRSDVMGVVISDLTYAVANLPVKPSQVGHAGQAAALHFLAKAYLTRGNLFGAAADYQSAYDNATKLINSQSSYYSAGQVAVGLLTDYAKVNLEGYENSSEVLFNVQHTWSTSGPTLTYDDSGDGGSASGKENRSNFFYTAGYENVKYISGLDKSGNPVQTALVPRSIIYQRPWRMIMPTYWLVFKAFADKTNDSRWDNSFRTEWYSPATFKNVGGVGRTVSTGNLAIKVSLNTTETSVTGDSVASSGVIFKPYALYYWGMLYNSDSTYKCSSVQYMYPNLTKFDDTKRLGLNYDSDRPVIIARLAETYLIAAEAAFNLNQPATAASLINVVRERAAYRSSLSSTDLATRKAAMDITASQVTLDFILTERSREMCCEWWRWIDLVRTKTLVNRVKAYNVKGKGNIKDYMMLRPVPQSQIDAMTSANKATYQNPGY